MNTKDLKPAARKLLEENILRFWLDKMQDTQHGGFHGRMDGHDRLDLNADKGAVLNARILWAFAAAYRVLGKAEYLAAATRAKNYLLAHFLDREHGGIYWSVDALGQPRDTKKQTYAISFAIYGLSEYARATGDAEALRTAVSLFRDIEDHAFDGRDGGYVEALTRDWQPIADMRLSDKDENGSRTMNTHLHVLEAYTNLFRVWPDEHVARQLRVLIGIFMDKLMNPRTHHLDLFFDDRWQGRRDIESYGHDIEASWLLTEALDVLADVGLAQKVRPQVLAIARASEEGLCPDGSMIHEFHVNTGTADCQRQWWVQCECVIGEINLHQATNEPEAMRRALDCWQYIEEHLVDHEHGEWHWSIHPDGTVNRDDDKAGFWKCPYHNSRMCLEILERENL